MDNSLVSTNSKTMANIAKRVDAVVKEFKELSRQRRQLKRLDQTINLRQQQLGETILISPITSTSNVFDDSGWIFPDNPALLSKDREDVTRFNYELKEFQASNNKLKKDYTKLCIDISSLWREQANEKEKYVELVNVLFTEFKKVSERI